jgi:hypothetical protein
MALINQLVHATGAQLEADLPTAWRWKNKPVYLIDGTTMTMPDTPENQARYPQQSVQKTCNRLSYWPTFRHQGSCNYLNQAEEKT